MSKENVEVVQQIYEAVAHRDAATILALYDPQVQLHFSADTLADHITSDGQRVWTGHEGLRNFDRELRETFQSFQTTCEELIDAGAYVVTASKYRARGRSSGVEIEGPFQFGVWSVREGKVVRVVWFSTRAQALEAAGWSVSET